MPNKKLLLGLTTTPGSDWQGKIQEIEKFDIREIALFPTFLSPEKRKELYGLIEKINLDSIPLAHLRHDMENWELDYLAEKFGCRIFNIHAGAADWQLIERNLKYRPMIFVENMYSPENESFTTENFEKHKIAGVCLDLSHLEIDRIVYPDSFRKMAALLEKYPIGWNHISGVKNQFWRRFLKDGNGIARHNIQNVSELDYLRNYPPKYFSPYLAIELENSFAEQLKFKNYLERILELN